MVKNKMAKTGRLVLMSSLLVITGIIVLYFTSSDNKKERSEQNYQSIASMGDMKLESTAFENNGSIPAKYTCDGSNINPPLKISEVPEGAKSLVLIMDDPDVPRNLRPDGMWDHWLVWNIPVETNEIAEGEEPPGVVGKNTGGKSGYTGPCPPDREHRYFFKLYALDTLLDLPAETTDKKELEAVMEGHILAQAELIGRYNRR